MGGNDALDIETAFLNAPLNQKLNLGQSNGFKILGKERHVFLLLEDL